METSVSIEYPRHQVLTNPLAATFPTCETSWRGCIGPHGLTGWWYTYPSEKYEFVSWDYYSQHMEKRKTCSKPPTRYIVIPIINHY